MKATHLIKKFHIYFLLILTLSGRTAFAEQLTVFAAASTTNIVSELNREIETRQGIRVTTAFASSSTLAKQIEKGAPADIYLSANTKWIDYLKQKSIIKSGQVFYLFSNQIVVIAPKKSIVPSIEIDKFPFQAILQDGYMAIADPSHTPAGNYSKKALEYYGIWPKISKKIAPMKDVRAALMLVERQESPLGILYATDAQVSNKVKIVGVFPEKSHPPIIYLAAAIGQNPSKKTLAYLAFLKSEVAMDIYRKHGFITGGNH